MTLACPTSQIAFGKKAYAKCVLYVPREDGQDAGGDPSCSCSREAEQLQQQTVVRLTRSDGTGGAELHPLLLSKRDRQLDCLAVGLIFCGVGLLIMLVHSLVRMLVSVSGKATSVDGTKRYPRHVSRCSQSGKAMQGHKVCFVPDAQDKLDGADAAVDAQTRLDLLLALVVRKVEDMAHIPDMAQ